MSDACAVCGWTLLDGRCLPCKYARPAEPAAKPVPPCERCSNHRLVRNAGGDGYDPCVVCKDWYAMYAAKPVCSDAFPMTDACTHGITGPCHWCAGVSLTDDEDDLVRPPEKVIGRYRLAKVNEEQIAALEAQLAAKAEYIAAILYENADLKITRDEARAEVERLRGEVADLLTKTRNECVICRCELTDIVCMDCDSQ